MNEINQPPQMPPAVNNSAQLGDDPAERVPITGVVSAMEAILRQPRRVMFQFREPGAGKVIGALMLIAVVCSLIYGVILGSFSGGDQWWAAPVKACIGLLVSAVICLPSLYIFASLGGSQARLTEIVWTRGGTAGAAANEYRGAAANEYRIASMLGTASTFLPQEKKFFLSHWIDSMEPDR